jgi:hypothetical protein
MTYVDIWVFLAFFLNHILGHIWRRFVNMPAGMSWLFFSYYWMKMDLWMEKLFFMWLAQFNKENMQRLVQVIYPLKPFGCLPHLYWIKCLFYTTESYVWTHIMNQAMIDRPVRIRVLIDPPDLLVCHNEATEWGVSFEWNQKNWGPVSQQVWHDKDPSLLKGPELIVILNELMDCCLPPL